MGRALLTTVQQHLALAGDSRDGGLPQASGPARTLPRLALSPQDLSHIRVRGTCEAREQLGARHITLYCLFSQTRLVTLGKKHLSDSVPSSAQGCHCPIRAQPSSQLPWGLKQVPAFHGSPAPRWYDGDKGRTSLTVTKIQATQVWRLQEEASAVTGPAVCHIRRQTLSSCPGQENSQAARSLPQPHSAGHTGKEGHEGLTLEPTQPPPHLPLAVHGQL